MSAGKAITFNSSAKDIIQKLKKAKAQNALPLKAAIVRVCGDCDPEAVAKLQSLARDLCQGHHPD